MMDKTHTRALVPTSGSVFRKFFRDESGSSMNPVSTPGKVSSGDGPSRSVDHRSKDSECLYFSDFPNGQQSKTGHFRVLSLPVENSCYKVFLKKNFLRDNFCKDKSRPLREQILIE